MHTSFHRCPVASWVQRILESMWITISQVTLILARKWISLPGWPDRETLSLRFRVKRFSAPSSNQSSYSAMYSSVSAMWANRHKVELLSWLATSSSDAWVLSSRNCMLGVAMSKLANLMLTSFYWQKLHLNRYIGHLKRWMPCSPTSSNYKSCADSKRALLRSSPKHWHSCKVAILLLQLISSRSSVLFWHSHERRAS